MDSSGRDGSDVLDADDREASGFRVGLMRGVESVVVRRLASAPSPLPVVSSTRRHIDRITWCAVTSP